MNKLNKVPEEIKKQVKEIQSFAGSQKEETRRIELWEDVNNLVRGNKREYNVLQAVSLMSKLDKGFAEEFAFESENQGFDGISKNIETYARNDGFKRAAQPISADSFNGDEDFSDQYVEKEIVKRLEDEVNVLQFVWRKTGRIMGRGKYKSAKFPLWDDDFLPTPKAKGANLDDFTDDTTGGIGGTDNKIVEAYKLGLTMDFEAEAYLKLDPAYLAELIAIGRGVYARGVKNNIYLGNGTAPNATGMWTNATAVTYTDNIINTVKLMLAGVGDADRATKGFFMITNTAGAADIASEVATNESFNMNIAQTGGIAGSVMGVPILVDNSFKASGTSPNKTAPLYLGSTGRYFYVDSGLPEIVTDPYADFKSGEQSTRIMGFVGGDVSFDNSFAKTTLTAVY